MIIMFGICAILLVLLIFCVALLTKEKQKNGGVENVLAGEFETIATAMNKFSMGLLNQHIPASKNNLPAYIKNGIEKLRSSFNKITCDPLNRVCFVGTDAWFEGIACADYVGNRLKDGGKIIIVVTSSLEALVMAQRHRSFVNTIKKMYAGVKIVETYEAHANQDMAASYVASMADKIDGIYITGNSLVPGVTRGLEMSGRQAEVFVLCHDLDAAIVENMQKDLVSASVVCSPYLQSHDAIIHLYNHIATGWKPFQPRLMQSLHTVIKDDLNDFWDFENQVPRTDIEEKKITPMKTTILKHRRILVFAEDWNSTFAQMLQGITAATEELKNNDCEIIVQVLNQLKTPEKQVIAKARRILVQEKAKGLDGIVAFVGIQSIVDLLNAYSIQGIPVATYNSEPLTVRSMIEWLILSATQLGVFTKEYRRGLGNVEATQKNIYGDLEAVVDRSQNQITSIEQSAISVNEFSGYIQETSDNEAVQSKAVEQTTQISAQLGQIVKSFDENVNRIKTMGEQVRVSVSKTTAIKEFSQKIGSILGIIDNISAQTNLLAFNAAVESTHAGEFGEGFKVISQEIRTLADQSVKSTADIAKLIQDMQQAVTEGISANDNALITVNEQVQSITDISQQLSSLASTLLQSVDQVQTSSKQNAIVFGKMKDSSGNINRVMSNTASIFEENNDTVHKITTEFSAMSEKFSSMAQRTKQLAELINIMEGTVSSFTSL